MASATWSLLSAALTLAAPTFVRATTASPNPGLLAQGGERVAQAKKAKKKKVRKGRRGKAPAGKPDTAPPSTVKAQPEAPPAPPPASLPPPPALPDKYKAVAVLPAVGLDVDADLVHAVEHSLTSEIDEHPGMRAVSPQDVQNDLSAHGLDALACEGDSVCLARAGRYARAHLAFAARIASLGGTLNVSLRLIDTASAQEIGRVADPVSDDPAERAQELHRMAVQVLAPDTFVGSLAISSPVAGAEVYLDDKLVGTTPLPGPLAGLPAGPHILRMSKPGFADLHQFVDVVFKRSATITVDLANNTIAGQIVEVESKTGFGSLFVACNQSGVEIRVDGEPKGITPLTQAIDKIAAGKRRLSLRKEGLAAYVQEVEIKAKRRLDVGVTLSAAEGEVNVMADSALGDPLPYDITAGDAPLALGTTPGGWSPSWRTSTGLVAGGLAVASFSAWSYFGLQIRKIEAERDDVLAEAEKPGADVSALTRELEDINDRGQQAELLGWASLGAAGGLALVGGGLLLWDLFRDPTSGITPAPSLGAALMPIPGGAQVVIQGGW